MDPFYTGLIIGILFGGTGGVLALALVSHSRGSDDERDAARFRALQAHASAVNCDNDVECIGLAELADTIRSESTVRLVA